MPDLTTSAAIDRAGELLGRARSALGIARGADPLAGYRITDAIRYAISGRTDAENTRAASWFDDEFQRAGHVPRSKNTCFIPAAAIVRALQPYQTTVTGAGAELVEATMHPELFVDALRPRSVVLRLGATTVGGLVGDAQIPRQDTTSTAYWVTTSGTSPVVSGALTESEGTFDSSPLIVSPAQVGAYGTASRLFLKQGGDLAEKVLANDLAKTLATAIDAAALAGTGTAGQPTGVVNTSGVGTASGATFAYATAVGAVQTVAAANGLINRQAAGWVAPPATSALLAQREKVTGYPSFIWDGNADTGRINGHQALATTNAPSGTAIFGDWSQILILSWGENAPVEVEFSQFGAGFAAGDVQFRAFLSANIVVRRAASFVVVSGVT